MKKLSIILMLAVMALFIFSVTAMAAEVEHRVYVEFASVSEFSDEFYYLPSNNYYKEEEKDYFDEGITLGYEVAFATSNESLKVLAGGNFSINSELSAAFANIDADADVDFSNVYSGAKYQLSDNKIKPYLVGRLGLTILDIDTNWYDEDIGLYAGVGIGIQPIEKMSAELMYLYSKNEYDDSEGDSDNCKITYKRWALSVGYLF